SNAQCKKIWDDFCGSALLAKMPGRSMSYIGDISDNGAPPGCTARVGNDNSVQGLFNTAPGANAAAAIAITNEQDRIICTEGPPSDAIPCSESDTEEVDASRYFVAPTGSTVCPSDSVTLAFPLPGDADNAALCRDISARQCAPALRRALPEYNVDFS
ncbi:unnamed protein product, partial [Amoebophrya sp. A25]